MNSARAAASLGVTFIFFVLGAPLVRGENAVLRAKIIDAQSGRTKATFVTRTLIMTPPDGHRFVYHCRVRLPKPVGRVAIEAQVQFLGFSRDAVWFALNTDAKTADKRRAGVQRLLKARAFVRYGQSHTLDNLFSADGRRLTLVITPTREAKQKPTFSLWRIFGRASDH